MIRIIEAPIAFVAAIGSRKAVKVCGLLNRIRKWECKVYSHVTRRSEPYAELEHRMTIEVVVYLLGIGSMVTFEWLCWDAFFR